MKTVQRRFIIQLLIISVLFYAALYFIAPKLSDANMPITVMIAFLFAVNTLAFILVSNTKEKHPRSFVYSHMMISFGRLILFSVFVFSYALMHRQGARVFALTFFVLYFLYNIIEVRAIYNFFKN